MSAPEASTTRQRSNKASTDPDVLNPTSLGTTSAKNVRRSKPVVNPPFYNVSMNKFLMYLTLSLAAIGAFYAWRFTVWASNAGGYWNLITGKRAAQAVNNQNGVAGMGSDELFKSAASAASAAGSAASSAGANSAVKGGKGKTGGAVPKGDVQSHIFTLASALGVTPHDLTAAIRPLIDPSVPNPIEAAAKEIEMLKLQLQAAHSAGATAQAAAAAAPAAEEAAPSAGLLGIVSEVLLD